MSKCKKFSKTILFVLLAVYFISIIPLYGLGVLIYRYGIHKVEESFSDSVISEVSFLLRGIELDISNIRVQQYDSLNDPDLSSLSSMPSGAWGKSEEFRMVRNVQSKLITMASGTSLVDDIITYLPNYGNKISAYHGVDAFTDDDMEWIKTLFSYKGRIISYKEDKLYIAASYPVFNERKKSPNLIIVTELSYSSLNELLIQYHEKSPDTHLILMNTATHQILAGTLPQKELSIAKTLLDQYNNEGVSGFFTINPDNRYVVSWVNSVDTGFTLYGLIPENQLFNKLYQFRVWLLIFSITSILVMLTFAVFVYFLINKPIGHLIGAFHRVENGDLSITAYRTWCSEFQILFNRFNDMVCKLDTHIEQEYRYQILAREAELKQLQFQISPHFLYNTYFVLNSLLHEEDFDKAYRLTKLLGVFLEYISHSNRLEVPLMDEVAHAKAYADIQQMRFSKCVNVHFNEEPEKYKNLAVPQLILQPLIENSFVHGIKQNRDVGNLSIDFVCGMGCLDIIVEDDGNEMTDDRLQYIIKTIQTGGVESSGIALSNIHRRLRLKFGEKSGLFAGKSLLGGLKISIHLEGV